MGVVEIERVWEIPDDDESRNQQDSKLPVVSAILGSPDATPSG